MDKTKKFSEITERLGATYKVTNTLKAYDEKKFKGGVGLANLRCIDYDRDTEAFDTYLPFEEITRPITWYASEGACKYVIDNLDAELRIMYSVEDELWK